MWKKKNLYLNDRLTLSELARQVGMNRNQLSSVINNGIGDSFYTFINKYRVEEAKRLIAHPKNANFTLLSLAFEAGFPSKSSFHNIFKKLTGITPAEDPKLSSTFSILLNSDWESQRIYWDKFSKLTIHSAFAIHGIFHTKTALIPVQECNRH